MLNYFFKVDISLKISFYNTILLINLIISVQK